MTTRTPSRIGLALAGRAASIVCVALLATTTSADVIIDEFSHVGIYQNPWPYIQTEPGHAEFYETVTGGMIPGENGRFRETFVASLSFAQPGVDTAKMGVVLEKEIFEYAASPGIENYLDFGYSYSIMNPLRADFSGERGIRLEFRSLRPGVTSSLSVGARIVDMSRVRADIEMLVAMTPGSQSVFLAFPDFQSTSPINLADIGAIQVGLQIPGGTAFELVRIVGTRPRPGDANADGIVDVQDLLAVLLAWGACSGCLEDFNDDEVVDVQDLLIVLGHWGSCS